MSTTYSGTHVLLGPGLALTALLSGLTGGLWWFWTTFTLWGDVDRESHQVAGLGLVICAIGTAVLGTAVGFYFRAPLWSLVVVAVSVIGVTAGAVHELVAATTAQPSGSPEYTARDLWLLAAIPTSWPLLAFAVVALVQALRARWSPGPRPRPAR